MFDLSKRSNFFYPSVFLSNFESFLDPYSARSNDTFVPLLDVVEDDGNYKLTMEIPAINATDIEINVESNYITISGKKEINRDEKQGLCVISERFGGSFSRSMRFAKEIDPDKIDAIYKDGVLSVVIPKKEPKQKNKIEVRVSS